MMLTMDNGCGVLGDVSYLAPDSSGYNLPFYWRVTFWGQKGILEIAYNVDSVALAIDGETGICHQPLLEGNPGGYLSSFVRDVEGNSIGDELCTEQTLRATRIALTIQEAADKRKYGIALG